jgi:recombination protein RecA
MMPTLEEVLKKVNKEVKANIANRGVVVQKIQRIPFSSPRLTYMTYGGLPVGRLVEFSGDEGGGKTTTALDVIANAQRLFPDKQCVYVDIEHTFDEEWASLLGVDVDSLIIITPEAGMYAEQIFEIVKSVIDTGEVSVCVFDSFGALVSKLAYEKTIEERTFGGIAMALTAFGNKMIPICARTKCLFIGINQMRDDMNSQHGGSTTTGGRGWRHTCSVRMMFMKSDFIDEAGKSIARNCENPAGNLVKVFLIKSKVFKGNRKVGFYTLKYLEGIDWISDTIDVALKENLVMLNGAWYSIVDPETKVPYQLENGKDAKFQGKAELHRFLEENTNWRDDLKEQVLLKLA